MSWSRLVLDEAQVIKNPANDTSQQLKTIPAASRIALKPTCSQPALRGVTSTIVRP